MIRAAELADVPRLVEMGEHFIDQTGYRAIVARSTEQLTKLAIQLVSQPATSTILVVEEDGALRGMLGLIAMPHFISGELSAGEVFWWVEPEARGSVGMRLWLAGEAWAREKGATSIQMIAPDDRVGKLYTRRGYVPIERSYYRRLDVA